VAVYQSSASVRPAAVKSTEERDSSLGSEDRHFEDSLNEVVSTCGFSVTFES
jgi:hypothetical protein